MLLILNFSDIKPENVLLLTNQQNPDWRTIQVWDITPKLGDFGIARAHDFGSMSFTQTISGTPFYMAPEQFDAAMSGDARFRGNSSMDIYPIGVISHELMTGKRKNRKLFLNVEK